MNIIDTSIPDVKIIEPKVWSDERGYFFESYTRNKLSTFGINHDFVQDNEAKSSHGILRGLHYQLEPYAQTKLVRVIKGKVVDVAVDIRPNSPTYGQHVMVELSEDNKRQLLVPRGFAHGYLSLSDETIFCYKCDGYYNKEAEGGILWSDSKLAINWPIDGFQPLVSEKDNILPSFGQHKPYQ